MECQECQKLISAYVDGMVSPQEEQQIISHMKKCTICQEEYEALKQIKQMCEQIEEVEVPDRFHGELMKKVNAEAKAKKVIPMKKHWRWQYGGALVATILVGGLFLNQLERIGNPFGNETTLGEGSKANDEVSMARIMEEPEVESGQEDLSKQVREVPMPETALDSAASSEATHEESWTVYVSDKSSFEDGLVTYLNQNEIDFEKTQSGYEVIVEAPEAFGKWIIQHSLRTEGIQQGEEANVQCSFKVELTIETK